MAIDPTTEIQNPAWEQVKANLEKKFANISPFYNRAPAYFNDSNLFVIQHNDIPSVVTLKGMDCEKAEKWMTEMYDLQIIQRLYDKKKGVKDKKAIICESIIFFEKPLLVAFNYSHNYVNILYADATQHLAETLISDLSKMKKRSNNRTCMIMLMDAGMGLVKKEVDLLRPSVKINAHYNDDFHEVDQIIVRRLSKKNDKGIVLLHGKPGTGKTSYIRYLISRIRKTVIFLPPGIADRITHPEFISLLSDYPNAILVIEDAENLILDRESTKNSSVSGLLNLSDGLLSDCLSIQIICSFNTDISKIDSALMRKGRLIAAYEFKELQVHKAQSLSAKLGCNSPIVAPMTLSAIYHQSERDFQKPRPAKIGF